MGMVWRHRRWEWRSSRDAKSPLQDVFPDTGRTAFRRVLGSEKATWFNDMEGRSVCPQEAA